MISDTERREVARRLRSLDDSELQVYDMTYFAIQRAVGGDGDQCPDGRELADRLADLIEPSGHECVPGECPLNVCHDNDRIDRDALLALAEDVDEAAAMAVVMDASKGAKLLADLLLDIARRIREALGVER